MDLPLMKKSYVQKYRQEWESNPDFKGWLKPVIGKPTKALCLYCKTEFFAKLSDIKKHLSTSKHEKEANIRYSTKQKKIDFKPIHESNLQLSRNAEASLSMYIAEHCSVLSVDHLTETCKKVFADSRAVAQLSLHRTKCTEVIRNVLAPHFKNFILNDIGAKKFSLILDESTNVTVTKELGIVIRYFSENQRKFISTFFALVPLKSCTARDIVVAVADAITSSGLNMKNLVGIGTDNASVMIGVNQGVYKILKEEYDLQNLILVRCVCHSLQLAVSHASIETLPRNIEFLIRETYNWFSHSSSRQEEYRQIYELINLGEAPLKILKMANTRWLSIESAVSRILSQWTELTLHFELVKRNTNCYTAEILHSMYIDDRNKLYLLYIKPILSEVQRAVKAFEGENSDPTKLLNTLTGLLRSVASRIIISTARVDFCNAYIQDYLDPSPYLGVAFENGVKESGLSQEDEGNLRQRCINFTLKLFKELQQRLPDNLNTLQKMSLLNVDEALKQNKNLDILDLGKSLGYTTGDLDNILSQWRNISFIKWNNVTDTTEFWTEVHFFKDAVGENPFKELCNLAITALSLPHSNAEVERTFSLMNLIQTKLRNRISNENLSAIIMIRASLKSFNETCWSYNLPENVKALIGTSAAYSLKKRDEQPSTSRDITKDIEAEILLLDSE